MAASSITKNFVIADKDDVEAFADALEKAANTDYPPIPTLGRQVTDPKEIKALMIRLKGKTFVDTLDRKVQMKSETISITN